MDKLLADILYPVDFDADVQGCQETVFDGFIQKDLPSTFGRILDVVVVGGSAEHQGCILWRDLKNDPDLDTMLITEIGPLRSLSTSNTGYYRIRVDTPGETTVDCTRVVILDSMVNSDGCLSSLRVKNHQKEILKHHSRITGLDIHGPAVNLIRDSIPGFASYDHVIALKSDTWPENILLDIGQLRSKLNFLTPEQIDKVLELPCLFVPFPHPSDKDNEYVWRVSFSQHELEIFQSLPLVCKRTYFMCKDMVKSASEQNESLKILKSYYLKTTIFHLCSTEDLENWDAYGHIRVVLDSLNHCISSGFLANFFIASQNLIQHLSACERSVVSAYLQTVVDDQWTAFKRLLHQRSCFDTTGKCHDKTWLICALTRCSAYVQSHAFAYLDIFSAAARLAVEKPEANDMEILDSVERLCRELSRDSLTKYEKCFKVVILLNKFIQSQYEAALSFKDKVNVLNSSEEDVCVISKAVSASSHLQCEMLRLAALQNIKFKSDVWKLVEVQIIEKLLPTYTIRLEHETGDGMDLEVIPFPFRMFEVTSEKFAKILLWFYVLRNHEETCRFAFHLSRWIFKFLAKNEDLARDESGLALFGVPIAFYNDEVKVFIWAAGLKLEDIGRTSSPPMLSVHLMLFVVFLWVKAAYRNRNKSELDEIHIIRELKLDVWTQHLLELPEWEKLLLSSIQRMIARYNSDSRK